MSFRRIAYDCMIVGLMFPHFQSTTHKRLVKIFRKMKFLFNTERVSFFNMELRAT